jgi:hypothetical protein
MDRIVKFMALAVVIISFLNTHLSSGTDRFYVVLILQILVLLGLFKDEIIKTFSICKGFYKKRKTRRVLAKYLRDVDVLLDQYGKLTVSNRYQSLFNVTNASSSMDVASQKIRASRILECIRFAQVSLLACKDPVVGLACAHTGIRAVHNFVLEIWPQLPQEIREASNGKQFVIQYNNLITKMRETFSKLPNVNISGKIHPDQRNWYELDPLKEYGYTFEGIVLEYLV